MIKKKGPCPGCGAEIVWIRCQDGKTYQAEEEPVWIRVEVGGSTFFRKDGGIVFGIIVGDAYDAGPAEEVYLTHKWKCPQGGRKRRRSKG